MTCDPVTGISGQQGHRAIRTLWSARAASTAMLEGYLIGGIGAQTPDDGVDMVVDRQREVNPYRRMGLVLIEFNSVAVAIIAAMPARLSAICIASPSEMTSSAT